MATEPRESGPVDDRHPPELGLHELEQPEKESDSKSGQISAVEATCQN